MTNDQDAVSRLGAPNWTHKGAAPQGETPQWKKPAPLDQFLGGPPAAVLLKLILVSLIVGAMLMWLGLRPADLLQGFLRSIDRLWSLGFDAVREAADYILAGAMIVVPVWLILRLLNMRHAGR